MEYVDEFRDPAAAGKLMAQIEVLADAMGARIDRPLKIMEMCGGHTHTILKFGLGLMLPSSIEFVHGPGCPICLLPMGRIDDAIAIARTPGVIFATYQDAMRVPGSTLSLLQARELGADIRTVESPRDALELARQHRARSVVFFGVGFESTSPLTAQAVLEAEAEGIINFYVFSNHVATIPTLQAILDQPDLQPDGFLGPAHVSTVIGVESYQCLCEEYGRPIVIGGFTPVDVLESVYLLLLQLKEGRCEVESLDSRLASDANHTALDAIARVFAPRERFECRGLGSVQRAGLRLRAEYSRFDAEMHFAIPALSVPEPHACLCGDVLKGGVKPWKCTMFGTDCTPQAPLGACMASSEGACAACYHSQNP